MEAPKPAIPLDVVARMTRVLPHVEALGAEVAGVEEGYGLMKADWREDLVGNPATGVLHGGVITALLDTASGIAVFTSVPEVMMVATLDLRIDYLKPAVPRKAVFAEARCIKLTRSIAFVRGRAYHEPDHDIAVSMASFMLLSSALPGSTLPGEAAG
jgi:uncharacterized protein (TIGR00369 family)